MIKNIIFLIDSPLNKRDFDRFGIQALLNEGFEVNIWDLTLCIHRAFYSTLVIDDKVSYQNMRIFEKKTDIQKSISELQETDLVVCFIGFAINSLFIYRALSQHSIRYCVSQVGLLPVSIYSGTPRTISFSKFIKKFTGMKIHSIASNVVDILIKHHFRLFGVRPAAILLLSGKRSDEPNLYPIDETTKKIWIHLMDYDIYLEQHQHATDPKPGRYAVFLDEYVPFHPDYKYMRVEPPVSADEYYPKLRSFFEFLENKFDLQVIIAAHPRSDYKDKQEYFGNRIVVRGKTAQLVRDSVFVIAHMSTAIDFAVLFRKPLIFITTEKISRIQSGSYPFGRYIDTTAAAFQKKPVIVDNMKDINWNSEMNVEDVVYQDYKNAFIKKDGTADLPFWKIFADYIHTQ